MIVAVHRNNIQDLGIDRQDVDRLGPAQALLVADQGQFLPADHEHKHSNNRQHWVERLPKKGRKETKQDKDESEHRPQGCSDLSRPDAPKRIHQQRPQDTAAVHGKCGNHVEQDQNEVNEKKGEHEVSVQEIGSAVDDPHGKDCRHSKYGCDYDVDRRTGHRDAEFLPRPFAHPFQARDSADGVERDVARGDAKTTGHQSVTELVQDDTAERRE